MLERPGFKTPEQVCFTSALISAWMADLPVDGQDFSTTRTAVRARPLWASALTLAWHSVLHHNQIRVQVMRPSVSPFVW